MKKLPISNINLENAVRVIESPQNVTMWRIKLDQYAITKNQDDKPIYAFESFELSVLLNLSDSNINDFALLNIRCLLCEDTHQFNELRFKRDDNTVYSIDDAGNIESINELSLEDSKENITSTPMERWGLPDEHPYNHLRISDNLSNELEDKHMLSTTTNDVVDRLWIDLKHSKSPVNIHGPVDVEGEFINYAALELKCGRIVLMTQDEKLVYFE